MNGVYVGTSGWSYGSWRGPFYPGELRRGDELRHIASLLNSVEINASFYRLQKPETYRRWYAATPADFVFAVKGSQFITHAKKLRDVETPLANFLASGVLLLREKLGPIVWQFAENQKVNAERLEAFLALLPKDTEAAAALAASHDHRLDGRSWVETDRKRKLRHAIEVRGEALLVPEIVRIARAANVAIVVSHAGGWRMVDEPTASFVYVRLHGAPDTYGSKYDERALDLWAERIRAWTEGRRSADVSGITTRVLPRHQRRDVFVYFDNDRYAHAPDDAVRLARRFGIRSLDLTEHRERRRSA
jgi:uncharacterized protein YecE (DUF72 family)